MNYLMIIPCKKREKKEERKKEDKERREKKRKNYFPFMYIYNRQTLGSERETRNVKNIYKLELRYISS